MDLTEFVGVSTQTITRTGSYLYVPTWMDYATSGEKLINDRLEQDIAFAAICHTDTTFPYGCSGKKRAEEEAR